MLPTFEFLFLGKCSFTLICIFIKYACTAQTVWWGLNVNDELKNCPYPICFVRYLNFSFVMNFVDRRLDTPHWSILSQPRWSSRVGLINLATCARLITIRNYKCVGRASFFLFIRLINASFYFFGSWYYKSELDLFWSDYYYTTP